MLFICTHLELQKEKKNRSIYLISPENDYYNTKLNPSNITNQH